MRTVLIFNPTSGSSSMAVQDGHLETAEQREEEIVNTLLSQGVEVEVWHTTEEDAGDGLAKKAAEEGFDTVIASGGDGTIHAVASGLIGTKSTLGIIATGTMNNLAHSLSIPDTIEGACAIIAKGETKKIDIGNINNHIFLEVAGIGLEAALFPAAEEIKSRGWLSTVRGVYDGIASLLSFKPAKIKVSFDGHRSRLYSALQVTVCNSPYYGVHLQVAPGTLMDDGLLDVVIYKNFSKLEFIRHSISITQGKRILEPKITRRKIKTLHITADYPVAIHADGVIHGHTPALISVTPGALRVRVPANVAEGPNVVDGQKRRLEKNLQNDEMNTLTEEKGTVNVNKPR